MKIRQHCVHQFWTLNSGDQLRSVIGNTIGRLQNAYYDTRNAIKKA